MTWTRCTGVLAIGVVLIQPAGSPGHQLAAQAADADELVVLPVQNGIHLIAGAGANIVVQVGREGVLLVDAGAPGASGTVQRAVETLSPGPVR